MYKEKNKKNREKINIHYKSINIFSGPKMHTDGYKSVINKHIDVAKDFQGKW